MDEPYVYQAAARRPGMIFAALAFAGFLAFGLNEAAPWYFYIPVVLGAIIILNSLVNNKINGLVLAPDYLTLAAWRDPYRIPLDDIAKVAIVSCSGTASMRVHLNSGQIVSAFPGDIPPREPFAAALDRLGIPLEIS